MPATVCWSRRMVWTRRRSSLVRTHSADSSLVASARQAVGQHTAPDSGTGTVDVPPGAVEVTQELTFELDAPAIDFARGSLQVTMRVVNPTARPIRGPIEVRLDRLTSDRDQAMGLERFRVANADNGKEGVGAAWTFSAGQTNVVPPNGKTEPRVLRFSFTGGVPPEPHGYFEPAFRIFAR